jgi:methionyl-tRNA synthetase
MLLAPFMPHRARAIWQQLGMNAAIDANWDDALVWGGVAPGQATAPGEALFPRIEPPAA